MRVHTYIPEHESGTKESCARGGRLLMATMLTRMVRFTCDWYGNRFQAFHPAYEPPPELGLEVLMLFEEPPMPGTARAMVSDLRHRLQRAIVPKSSRSRCAGLVGEGGRPTAAWACRLAPYLGAQGCWQSATVTEMAAMRMRSHAYAAHGAIRRNYSAARSCV